MATEQPPVPEGFKLNRDGSAADPAAFVAALRADPAKLAAVQQDEELSRIVFGDDVGKLQALLRDVYKEEQRRLEQRAQRMGDRSIDAQRASAPVPRDTVQVYDQLRRSGLQYGPAFRLLRNVHVPDAAKGA